MLDQSREPEHEGYEPLRRVVSQTGSCVNRCSERSFLANVPDVLENVPLPFVLYFSPVLRELIGASVILEVKVHLDES